MAGGSTAAVAEALGWRVVRPYAGGEFGATLVEDARGGRAVLKAVPDGPAWTPAWAASVGLAERLRATGYPAPRYLGTGTAAGHRYTIQEEMAGEVPDLLTGAHARQLLALAERHAGMGAGPRAPHVPAWRDAVRDALGGTLRPERTALVRASGPEAARLLDEVEALSGRLGGLALRSEDVVHGDFHHRNLLADGDRVTAVIDWEQAMPGDWRYDVLWLAFWCRADRRGVEPLAAELAGGHADALVRPDERAVYAGLLTLRLLDLFAHLWPDRLTRAIGWCESILAPSWR